MSDAQDAARWRWFRDHADLATDEDDNLHVGVWIAGDDWRDLPWMTAAYRRELEGRGPKGFVEDSAAIDAAVDERLREPPKEESKCSDG